MLILSVSYVCVNYVFFMFSQWLFVYLVEERGFSMLEGGVMYALPFISGAVLTVVGGAVCGAVCDHLCRRFVARLGCRVTAMTGLLLAPLIGLMIDRVGWLPTISSGSVFVEIAAGLWLLVRLKDSGEARQ